MKIPFQKAHDEGGFSLVELMVTVALVGILASLAVPQYMTFVAKARQTEAKVNLASLFVAETSFQAENGSFTACVYDAGFSPAGTVLVSGAAMFPGFYSIGFDSNLSVCGPRGIGSCKSTNWDASGTATSPCTGGIIRIDGTKNAVGGGSSDFPTPIRCVGAICVGPQIATVAGNQFVAGAEGVISPTAQAIDSWQINELKVVQNNTIGY
jgi:type IV pilus assembly protein PilA